MKKYYPTNLDADTIHTIFTRSVATELTTKAIRCILFKKDFGFPNDSRPIFFDKDALEKYQDIIEFMLGQLKDVHEKNDTTSTSTIGYNYSNSVWATNSQSILEILHMACAAGFISPINAKTSSAKFLKEIYPTLSPDDLNFSVWQKENKQKILSGQEPADN